MIQEKLLDRRGKQGAWVAFLVATLTAFTACTERADELMAPESASAVTIGSVTTSPYADAVVEDAITRLVPSLSDLEGAEPVLNALLAVQKQLENGDGASLRGAIAATQGVLDTYSLRTGASGDDADLEAVRLALESAMS